MDKSTKGEFIMRYMGVDDSLKVSSENLLKFIQSGVEESLNLEFKGSESWNQPAKHIGKSISAFANSEGGLLIVGMGEARVSGTKTRKAAGIEPIKDNLESFQQKLHNLVRPWPKSTLVVPVESGDGWVYLVDVPGEHYPPVQDNESKAFYFRLNAIDQPGEAYQVDMAYGRRLRPRLVPSVSLFAWKIKKTDTVPILDLFFRIPVRNEGPVAATETMVIVEKGDYEQGIGDPRFEVQPYGPPLISTTPIGVRHDAKQLAVLVTGLLTHAGLPGLVADFEVKSLPPVRLKLTIACTEQPAQSYALEITERFFFDVVTKRIPTEGIESKEPVAVELTPF